MALFWAIVALSLALVGAPILRALLRGPGDVRAQADLAIYRDQLAEIDRDLARGTLSPDEAERTRLEVQRRLLDADRLADAAPRQAPRAVRLAMASVAVFVLLGGAAIYAVVGVPGYGDLPLTERVARAEAARDARPSQAQAEAQAAPLLPAPQEVDPEFATMMDQLREVMAGRPDDVQGLRLLARNEAAMGNFAAARAAQDRLVTRLGDAATAADLATLGEVMALAAGGFVSPEAEARFDAALARDPSDGRAAYFKGLAHAQVGRPDLAFAIWQDLLRRGPADAPWIAPIEAQMEDVAARAGVRYDPPAPEGQRGPSAADVAAAADMSPEDRAAMIENMVGGLSQRLATDGGPAPDWARLIVALAVLGQSERATAIWGEAQGVFANSPGDLQIVNNAADQAGLSQ